MGRQSGIYRIEPAALVECFNRMPERPAPRDFLLTMASWLACITLSLPLTCRAAEITAEGSMVYLRGEIIPGDANRLVSIIRSLKRAVGNPPVLDMDSPGGDMEEGMDIGITVSINAIPVQIDFGSVCYSACFTAFVVAPRRVVYAPARIGVHQLGGRLDPDAARMTARAAELYRKLGLGGDIVQKLLQTTSDRIALLTEAEIRTLGSVDYTTLSENDIALKLIIRALRETPTGPRVIQSLTKSGMDQAETSLLRQMPNPGSDIFWDWYDAIWRKPELLIAP